MSAPKKADTDTDSTSFLKGLAFTGMMLLAAAFFNDSRCDTRGDFENRTDSGQRILINSGTYFSGTARVSCFRTSILPWVTAADEIVEYHRRGETITFKGSKGSAEFTISNQGLTDAGNVAWDRKFRGD